MKEKERYSLEEFDDVDWELAIVDNKLGKSLIFEEIKNLLNYQDREINRLVKMLYTTTKHADKLNEENQQLKTKYDNLYKCYQKTSQKDLKDKYNLAEKNEKLKAEKERLKEKISTQLQNNADNVDFMENQRREIEQLKRSQKELAISELEKVENILWDSQDIGNLMDNDKFLEKLNYRIKSLKGE